MGPSYTITRDCAFRDLALWPPPLCVVEVRGVNGRSSSAPVHFHASAKTQARRQGADGDRATPPLRPPSSGLFLKHRCQGALGGCQLLRGAVLGEQERWGCVATSFPVAMFVSALHALMAQVTSGLPFRLLKNTLNQLVHLRYNLISLVIQLSVLYLKCGPPKGTIEWNYS